MRPLDVIMGPNFSILPSIGDIEEAFRRQWIITEKSPTVEANYVYAVSSDDKTKFYENGFIYDADGSLADNELIDRAFYFHNFRHASLDKMLSQTVEPVIANNFLYEMKIDDYSNLQRIAAVRDRLHIPDWLAFLVFVKIADEDNVRSLMLDIPDFLVIYPLEWVLNALGVNPDDIDNFGYFDEVGNKLSSNLSSELLRGHMFEAFSEIIELERQPISSKEV